MLSILHLCVARSREITEQAQHHTPSCPLILTSTGGTKHLLPLYPVTQNCLHAPCVESTTYLTLTLDLRVPGYTLTLDLRVPGIT